MPDQARRQRVRDTSGAVAVEFGLIMPILLLLVFGLIQYGLYFLAYQAASDAVRSAARMSAVGNPGRCADLRAAVAAQVQDVGSTIVLTRRYDDVDLDGRVSVGDNVHLELTFRSVDLHIPILPFVDDGMVRTKAQARVEFLGPGEPEVCS